MESQKSEEGDWVTDKEALKNLVVNFYKGLFSTEPPTGERGFLKCSFPHLDEHKRNELEKDISSEEGWRALKGMGP